MTLCNLNVSEVRGKEIGYNLPMSAVIKELQLVDTLRTRQRLSQRLPDLAEFLTTQ